MKTKRGFRRKKLGLNWYGDPVYEITHIATGATVTVTRRQFDLPIRCSYWCVEGTRAFERRFNDSSTLDDVEQSLAWTVEDIANALLVAPL